MEQMVQLQKSKVFLTTSIEHMFTIYFEAKSSYPL
jgi:hypothetical protein